MKVVIGLRFSFHLGFQLLYFRECTLESEECAIDHLLYPLATEFIFTYAGFLED